MNRLILFLLTLLFPIAAFAQGFGNANVPTGFSATNTCIFTRTAVADAAHTQSPNESIVAYTSLSATRAVTLVTAGIRAGQILIIKDESGLAATDNITTTGVNVDGGTTATISTNYGSLRLYYNGATYSTW